MASRNIAATAILVDIESGLSNSRIGEKYGLSEQGVRDLFDKLLAHSLVTGAEYRRRVVALPRSIEPVGETGISLRSGGAPPTAEKKPASDTAGQGAQQNIISEPAQFIDVSKQGQNQWWTYAIGIFFMLVYAPVVTRVAAKAWTPSSNWDPKTSDFVGDPFTQYVLVNFSLVILFVGLFLVVRLEHKRQFISLVTPYQHIAWNKIAVSFGVFSALLFLELLASYLINPEHLHFRLDPDKFLLFLPVALLLTPIQTTTEELFFRGYLLQMTALLSRNRVILVLLPSVLFMAAHLINPEVAAGWLPMLLYYFSFGAFLTIVTLKTNGLEAAIGIHAASNLFAVLIASYKNSALKTPSVFYSSSLDPVGSLIGLYVMGALLYLLLFSRFSPLSRIMRPA